MPSHLTDLTIGSLGEILEFRADMNFLVGGKESSGRSGRRTFESLHAPHHALSPDDALRRRRRETNQQLSHASASPARHAGFLRRHRRGRRDGFGFGRRRGPTDRFQIVAQFRGLFPDVGVSVIVVAVVSLIGRRQGRRRRRFFPLPIRFGAGIPAVRRFGLVRRRGGVFGRGRRGRGLRDDRRRRQGGRSGRCAKLLVDFHLVTSFFSRGNYWEMIGGGGRRG